MSVCLLVGMCTTEVRSDPLELVVQMVVSHHMDASARNST